MFNNIIQKLGPVSWEKADKLASGIHKKAMSRKHLDWLRPGCIDELIDKETSLNSGGKEKVKRILAQKISKSLLKQCAGSLGVELKSLMCKAPNTFIVHKYMNPWILLDEHAGHINDPVKNYSLWHTHKHRQWSESLMDENDLIPDLIGVFEKEFEAELQNGSIVRLASERTPIDSSLYQVNRK